MAKAHQVVCSKTKWQGREAYTLSNGLIQIVNLTGGGHIAELRFAEGSGLSTLNPLWRPPWKNIEPYQYSARSHAKRYGPLTEGKLLSGIAGHNICLDYFGPPSEAETAQGLSTHGEAPSLKWRKSGERLRGGQLNVALSVRLPEAGLEFSREIGMRAGEAVVYLKETVTNERKLDHFFHWTQHVTLGPPFISALDTRVFMSATKGITSPEAYGEQALLAFGKEFQWPHAPSSAGGEADLSRCLARKGFGVVASLLADPSRDVQYVGALNTRERLLIAYCFRRADYPWITIWEENCSREAPPWNGRTETRGLEFGSAPLPVTRREAFARGPLLGTPTFSTAPARGRLTACYIAFLACLPEGFSEIRDISLGKDEILVHGKESGQVVTVPADGIAPAGLA
ncbi:conserved hypothetical protein [Acidobacteriia bacterium SbA2]|nr:conserved hypothetical protein [Acidobacteriia bacterium SbA2]